MRGINLLPTDINTNEILSQIRSQRVGLKEFRLLDVDGNHVGYNCTLAKHNVTKEVRDLIDKLIEAPSVTLLSDNDTIEFNVLLEDN